AEQEPRGRVALDRLRVLDAGVDPVAASERGEVDALLQEAKAHHQSLEDALPRGRPLRPRLGLPRGAHARGVLRGVVDVLPAPARDARVSTRPQAEPLRVAPVAEVVPRLLAGLRVVADLVAPVPRARE